MSPPSSPPGPPELSDGARISYGHAATYGEEIEPRLAKMLAERPPGDSSDESIEVVDDDDEADDEKRSRVEERDGSQSTSAKAAAAAEVRLSFQREIQIEKCTADVHVARGCSTLLLSRAHDPIASNTITA